jgi:hypothetical protein
MTSTNQESRYPRSNRSRAVLVDIDGTLALRAGRSPFDWSLVHTDSPNLPLIHFLRVLSKQGILIVCISGREEFLRMQTEKWLAENGIEPADLYMRTNNDYRNDAVIKREIYEDQICDRYQVIAVFDDRSRVVEMWRNELNLLCFQVALGNF